MQVTVSATAPAVARDSDGIALDGIRLPDVAVPVALNAGTNAGNINGAPCNPLSGAHVPFTKARLDTLYPTHDGYVAKVASSANQLVADGFMLRQDADDVIANAQSSVYGRQLNCDGALCQDQWLFPQHPSIGTLRWHIYLYYLPDRAALLAPVDQAAIQIASGYNTTDSVARRAFFDQAVVLLQQYAGLIQAQAAKGTLSSDAVSYLSGQATALISELQK
jgi:hypothetical protein